MVSWTSSELFAQAEAIALASGATPQPYPGPHGAQSGPDDLGLDTVLSFPKSAIARYAKSLPGLAAGGVGSAGDAGGAGSAAPALRYALRHNPELVANRIAEATPVYGFGFNHLTPYDSILRFLLLQPERVLAFGCEFVPGLAAAQPLRRARQAGVDHSDSAVPWGRHLAHAGRG